MHRTMIFAQHGTTKKFAIAAPAQFTQSIMLQLEQHHGGRWVKVDGLAPGEGILFDDGLTYLGFHGRDERYISEKHLDIIKP